jgi:hypothetical protein
MGKYKKSIGAAVFTLAVGVAGCGGGGGGSNAAAGDVLSDYVAVDARPAPTSAPVADSPAALSRAVGVGGAARMSGDIPSPASTRTRTMERAKLTKAISDSAAQRKLEAYNSTITGTDGQASTRIANTPGNYAAIQGGWSFTVANPTGYVFVGDSVYIVSVDCNPLLQALTTTDWLAFVTSVSANQIVIDVGGGPVTMYRSEQLAACVGGGGSGGGGSGGGGSVGSNVGQVSFSDNSTFSYSFTPSAQPSAVFIQLVDAEDYFVVPFSALQALGSGTYGISFYGPTPGQGVEQVIDELFQGQIVIQLFFGSVTAQQLLTGNFPGSEAATNWSAPVFVDYVAQPVASGELQFTLTWDSITDLDLHVLEPSGEEIAYYHRTSNTGGELDVDDTNGYGPENIFWNTDAPVGSYSAWVENYDGDAAANYTLTVTKRGVSTVNTGYLPASRGVSNTPLTVTMP